MACKKISCPANSMSSVSSRIRWKGPNSGISTIVAALMQIALVHHIVAFLFLVPGGTSWELRPTTVVVTNNHTKTLTVRCFSFFESDDPKPINRKHLKTNEQFIFSVTPSEFYPSTSMVNCSTNMGVFVAYSYDYNCSQGIKPTCQWRFDEKNTYHLNDDGQWELHDFNPNYESLGRGGVIRGYFTN